MNQKFIDILSQKMEEATGRFMLGICGAPGAGKSTVAQWIVAEWNALHQADQAVLVPMDGYHFSNEILQEMELLPLKGIPATFDAKAFLQKLCEIREFPKVAHLCPRFDRSIEASIADDIRVEPHHRLVVTEGNYLLLDYDPWSRIKDVVDEIWFIDAEEDLLYPRLLARHKKGGKNEEEAALKVASTDLPNARLVSECKTRADRIFSAG